MYIGLDMFRWHLVNVSAFSGWDMVWLGDRCSWSHNHLIMMIGNTTSCLAINRPLSCLDLSDMSVIAWPYTCYITLICYVMNFNLAMTNWFHLDCMGTQCGRSWSDTLGSFSSDPHWYLSYFNHGDYTDVDNGALRPSSMADTLTGSCLFVPISSPVQQFLAWIFGSKNCHWVYLILDVTSMCIPVIIRHNIPLKY